MSKFLRRINYWRRIVPAYLGIGKSQLTFWHETPEVNLRISELANSRIFEVGEFQEEVGQRNSSVRESDVFPYFMNFFEKADYAGPFDEEGIPLLDYRGELGRQYNPIAIAQYGLGNFNLWLRDGDEIRKEKSLRVADWLGDNLEENRAGLRVWNHHFDWEYRDTLRAPWYSGLAQGQGISMLVRAYQAAGEPRYLEAAGHAFEPMTVSVDQGGVIFTDDEGHRWIEEYIADPPTHILNGFIWALWGVVDYLRVQLSAFRVAQSGNRAPAAKLFWDSVETLKANLQRYDTGYWSLYEQSGTRLPMLSSSFYHSLHIVQLQVMHLFTGDAIFKEYADRWESYRGRSFNRHRALAQKAVFKLLYY